jgi:hypothetical protein
LRRDTTVTLAQRSGMKIRFLRCALMPKSLVVAMPESLVATS